MSDVAGTCRRLAAALRKDDELPVATRELLAVLAEQVAELADTCSPRPT